MGVNGAAVAPFTAAWEPRTSPYRKVILRPSLPCIRRQRSFHDIKTGLRGKGRHERRILFGQDGISTKFPVGLVLVHPGEDPKGSPPQQRLGARRHRQPDAGGETIDNLRGEGEVVLDERPGEDSRPPFRSEGASDGGAMGTRPHRLGLRIRHGKCGKQIPGEFFRKAVTRRVVRGRFRLGLCLHKGLKPHGKVLWQRRLGIGRDQGGGIR